MRAPRRVAFPEHSSALLHETAEHRTEAVQLIADVMHASAWRLPLTSLVANLIDHPAIVSAIAIADLTTAGRNVIAETYLSFEIWFTVAAMYLVMTITLSLLAGVLKRRLARPDGST